MSLAIYLLGPPLIKLEGISIKLDRHKGIALMAYLALYPEIHHRNTLALFLWPDYDQSRARAALRRTLASLNKAGLEPWLTADRETIRLENGSNFWLDVAQFRRSLVQCQAANLPLDESCLLSLTGAVNLYRDDFMAGFSLRDSLNFDEWQRLQTDNLRQDLSLGLARLVYHYQTLGQYKPSIAYARRWLAIDPLTEAAHRELMRLYAASDQRTAALRQYQECVRILKQELDVVPSKETTALYEYIQQDSSGQTGNKADRTIRVIEAQTPAEPQSPRSSTSAPSTFAKFPDSQIEASIASSPRPPDLHNFPVQLTPFIGRQRELADIANRLNSSECRLLTLTGPGGIGKTRLAVQAATAQSTNFNGGIYYIPLAPISSADFLISTIADSLNLVLDGQEDLEPQLLNYLRPKQMLLVTDNFEHLTRRAKLLTTILAEAPQVKFLATSRERLNLQGEWVFEVKGMTYPTGQTVDDIENYSAVALFLQRAYQAHSNFSLTEAEKPYLVRICQLMQGIPLGIELAASWTRVLSCQEISQEIEKIYLRQTDLDFLTTSLRDVPERHQNLRGVFEQSWQLLSKEEKRVFCKLSIFRGGAGREAIEWVTEAPLRLILALTDKSLLSRTSSGRYEMHELLRRYAADKFEEIPVEIEPVHNRHCEYYATFLQQREKRLKGTEQQETLAEIAREIENIRECWRWAISHKNIKACEKALESLWYFYAMYSWFQEGTEAFGRALSSLQARAGQKNNAAQDNIIGRIMTYLGWFYLRQGFYGKAKEMLQQSLAIFEKMDSLENKAAPLHHLGILAGEVGKLAEAIRLHQESLAIYRQVGNEWGIAWTLSSLAYHISEFDIKQASAAKQHLQESLAIYNTIGNKQGIAIALNSLGYITYKEGDYTAAKGLMEESLSLRREIGFPRGIVVALNNLGHITGTLGEYDACKAYYYEALNIARNFQTVPLALAALGGLAVPVAHQGNIKLAFELLTLVLEHPASNQESRDRALAFRTDLIAEHSDQGIVSLPETVPVPHAQKLQTLIDKLLAAI